MVNASEVSVSYKQGENVTISPSPYDIPEYVEQRNVLRFTYLDECREKVAIHTTSVNSRPYCFGIGENSKRLYFIEFDKRDNWQSDAIILVRRVVENELHAQVLENVINRKL